MVATKHIRIFGLLLLATLALFGYQNCAVDLANTTPGASNFYCAPDSAALTEFKIVEKAYLQPVGSLSNGKQGCATCHGQSSGNSAVGSFMVYGITTDGDAVSTKNFCSALLKGKSKLSHVQDASHSGGTYSTGDMPEYFDVIAEYF